MKAGMGVSTCLFNYLCIHSLVSTIHGEGWEGGGGGGGGGGGEGLRVKEGKGEGGVLCVCVMWDIN